MADERLKAKPLKLKKESGSELLKSDVKRPSEASERRDKGTNPDRKEQGLSNKGKEVVMTPGSSKDPVRSSSFGKNLVKVAKELKSNGKGETEGKSASKDAKAGVVKQELRGASPVKMPSKAVKAEVRSPMKVPNKEGRVSVKDEVRASPIKASSKEGRVSVKDEVRASPMKASSKEGRVSVKDEVRASPMKASSKEGGRVSVKDEVRSPIKVVSKEKGNANGKDQGKSVGKEAGKVNGKEQGKSVNGKSSGGVKVKDEDRNLDREKGKSAIAKSPLSKTPVKMESTSRISPKSTTKAGASPTVVKKKVTQITTTTVMATKTVTEAKKEKKVYDLPGQKHDPPEERDALRIFYSTLREQVPESEMAEFWLMEYGLLPHDEAQKAFERKQKRTQSSKQGPATKASTPSRLSNGSPAVMKSAPVSNGKGNNNSKVAGSAGKAKKKRSSSDSESDSDDDFLDKIATKKLKM